MTCPTCSGENVQGYLAVTGGLLCQCRDCQTISIYREETGTTTVVTGPVAVVVGAVYTEVTP